MGVKLPTYLIGESGLYTDGYICGFLCWEISPSVYRCVRVYFTSNKSFEWCREFHLGNKSPVTSMYSNKSHFRVQILQQEQRVERVCGLVGGCCMCPLDTRCSRAQCSRSPVGVPKTISPFPNSCLEFLETVGPFGKGVGFSSTKPFSVLAPLQLSCLCRVSKCVQPVHCREEEPRSSVLHLSSSQCPSSRIALKYLCSVSIVDFVILELINVGSDVIVVFETGQLFCFHF